MSKSLMADTADKVASHTARALDDMRRAPSLAALKGIYVGWLAWADGQYPKVARVIRQHVVGAYVECEAAQKTKARDVSRRIMGDRE